MKGVITQVIILCIKKGKRAKVAQRYLRAKYNVKIGTLALNKRFANINHSH